MEYMITRRDSYLPTFVQRESATPCHARASATNQSSVLGSGNFPIACLTDSSQADTALRKISLAGFAKIWLAVGDKSLAPAAIRKNVQVSRRHLTLGSLQTCEAALPEEARIMSVERKIFLWLSR